MLKLVISWIDWMDRFKGANPAFDENFSKNINEREAILGRKSVSTKYWVMFDRLRLAFFSSQIQVIEGALT